MGCIQGPQSGGPVPSTLLFHLLTRSLQLDHKSSSGITVLFLPRAPLFHLPSPLLGILSDLDMAE